MERRINEAKDQYQILKRECETTLELLNNLIHTCAVNVNSLAKLDTKEHRINLKYFVQVSQYQHSTHQKILELNVNLEEYLLDNALPDFDHFKDSFCATRSYRESETSYSPTSPIISKCQPEFPKPTVDDLLQLTDFIEIPTKTDKLQPEGCSELTNLDEYTVSLKPLETSSVLNDSASTSNTEVFFDLDDTGEYSSDNETTVQTTILPQDELVNDELITSTKVLDDLLPNNQDISLEVPSLDYVKPHISNISDALQSLPILSVEEKFLRKFPKPPMPDISLKPSDVKRFVVVDDNDMVASKGVKNSSDSRQDCDDLGQKSVTRKCTPKKNTVIPSEVVDNGNAVFEIGYRYTPLVGDICMIGHVESPSNFYVQVSDENSIYIDVIATQLEEINNNTTLLCSTKLDAVNQLGKFCTLAIDGTWYRAEVIDWLQSSKTDQVYIQLIDYGSQYSVSFKDLRPLPAFCRSYRIAQKCYLAYLYPPGSTKKMKLKDWPVACKEALLNYCGDMNNNSFRITYIQPSPDERDVYEIDLVRVNDNSDDKSIGEILLEAGLGVQIIDDVNGVMKHDGMRSQILAAHGCSGVTSDMTREEVLDIYFEEVDEEPSNINEAVMKYNPRDEAETCRNLRPNGTCYRGSSCKWRHEVLTSGFTRDKTPVYSRAFANLSLPDAGEEIFLTISHVVTMQCFYSQIRNASSGITSSISDLIKAMNEPQMIKQYKKFEQVPYASEVVIAKHWNNYWYRGQVRDVDSPDCKLARAEVYFVDFGDVLTIPLSDVRNIMPEFLALPFQAIECRLSNLKHKEGTDEDDERRYFESKLLGVTLKAHVVAAPGHLQVLLETRSGQDIGLQFIEEGFGELNTEMNFPNEDELILID